MSMPVFDAGRRGLFTREAVYDFKLGISTTGSDSFA